MKLVVLFSLLLTSTFAFATFDKPYVSCDAIKVSPINEKNSFELFITREGSIDDDTPYDLNIERKTNEIDDVSFNYEILGKWFAETSIAFGRGIVSPKIISKHYLVKVKITSNKDLEYRPAGCLMKKVKEVIRYIHCTEKVTTFHDGLY